MFTIRTMIQSELDFALDLAAAEGWNPGLHDAVSFFQADAEGFLIGLLDGQPIGCISAVSYDNRFGFLGLYIVRPEHRGRGYGMQLWQAAMQRMQGHVIGLDGVVAQQENYRKSGFTLAYRNMRYEGVARGEHGRDAGIVDAAGCSFEEIQRLDRLCFPATRTTFLQSWLRIPGATALACVEDGAMLGYGVLRPCRRGWKVGPLFAEDEAVADRLYRALCARVPKGEPVYLDVPEVNAAAMALAERHGMTRVFETARMYHGPAPKVSLERVFGVTTLELG